MSDKKSFTKEDFAKSLAETWDCSIEEAREKFDDVMNEINYGLEQGYRVFLDDIGTLRTSFRPHQKNKFVPGLGRTDIEAHVVIRFESSETLEENVQHLVHEYFDDESEEVEA
jgi:nucleoid DNA-binding protein